MILVSELRDYVKQKKEALAAVNFARVVVQKDELTRFLSDVSDRDNQIMICVMPSARSNGSDGDAIKMNNALGFFFLEKTEYSEKRQEEWLDVFERTQESALAFFYNLIDELQAGTCSWSRYLDIKSVSIDPESNFAGCNGWSVEVYFNIPV